MQDRIFRKGWLNFLIKNYYISPSTCFKNADEKPQGVDKCGGVEGSFVRVEREA